MTVISEVRSKGIKYRGRFSHRQYFDSLEEGIEWARDLAGRIVASGRYSDDEIVMEHTEVK
tara:strand:+ start:96 stop:278 length:183 start_codon:yes stop_codon:yes gene_type:complete